MRIASIVIVAAVAGAALGAGITWANFGNPPPLALTQTDSLLPIHEGDKQPKLLVDHRTHDFGAVDRDARISHTFQFTNAGQAPMTLRPGRTSCTRCTITGLSKTKVLPGETVGVTVEYLPAGGKRRFQQAAVVFTDDPNERRVELFITGSVTQRYRTEQPDLVFSSVSANETKTQDLDIYAFWSKDISLTSYEFTNPETAPFFEVDSKPIPLDELTVPNVRAALRLFVTLKPGLPLGPIRQTIRLHLLLGGSDTVVELPIWGTIDSDISIVGPGWKPSEARLSLGVVQSKTGATRRMLLVIRGPDRHGVKFKVHSVEPSWVEIEFGEPTELKHDGQDGGGVTQVPMIVKIPPGSPPCNYLPLEPEGQGKAVLETTHPQVHEMIMHLQFAVEK
jgi:hypothetical protein